MNNTTKIIANHFAITYETPEINPNPYIPAIIAIIKNNKAKINQVPTPLLFIIILIIKRSIYTLLYINGGDKSYVAMLILGINAPTRFINGVATRLMQNADNLFSME